MSQMTTDEYLQGFFRRYPRLKPLAPRKIVDRAGQGSSGHGEARQAGNEIHVYAKFWSHQEDIRDWIMAHEIGHYQLAKYGYSKYLADAAQVGIDVWDTASLPYGQFNGEEAFADCFAELFINPSKLKSRYPKWHSVLEHVVFGRPLKGAGLTGAQAAELDKYATRAFDLFRSDDHARTAEDVAMAVGSHAGRSGIPEESLKEWLQSSYTNIWVRLSGLNPGIDLKDVLKAMLKGYTRIRMRRQGCPKLDSDGNIFKSNLPPHKFASVAERVAARALVERVAARALESMLVTIPAVQTQTVEEDCDCDDCNGCRTASVWKGYDPPGEGNGVFFAQFPSGHARISEAEAKVVLSGKKAKGDPLALWWVPSYDGLEVTDRIALREVTRKTVRPIWEAGKGNLPGGVAWKDKNHRRQLPQQKKIEQDYERANAIKNAVKHLKMTRRQLEGMPTEEIIRRVEEFLAKRWHAGAIDLKQDQFDRFFDQQFEQGNY